MPVPRDDQRTMHATPTRPPKVAATFNRRRNQMRYSLIRCDGRRWQAHTLIADLFYQLLASAYYVILQTRLHYRRRPSRQTHAASLGFTARIYL